MNCPRCGYSIFNAGKKKRQTTVIDSRPTRGNNGVRRRRKCPVCAHRWTTQELCVPQPELMPYLDVTAPALDRCAYAAPSTATAYDTDCRRSEAVFSPARAVEVVTPFSALASASNAVLIDEID